MKSIKLPLKVLFLFLFLFIVNFIAGKFFFKIDLTKDNLFTLSNESKNIIKKIDKKITIKYYFSTSNDTLSTVIKNYGKRVEEFLKEYLEYNNLISFEIHDPLPDTEEELNATRYGIKQISAGVSTPFYIGAVAICGDKTFSIPFFDIRDENSLEFEITNMLTQVQRSKEKSKIGIITSLPLKSIREVQNEWLFISEIEKLFDIEFLAEDIEEIPQNISLLMLLHPPELIEETEYAIDQYILNGGKTAILVDSSARTSIEKNMARQLAVATSSNPESVFKTIGIKYHNDKVVADMNSAASVSTRDGFTVRYPFWLSLDEKNFNQNNFISKNFQDMLLIESSYFENVSKNDYISLINTKNKAGFIDSKKMNFMPFTEIENFNKENKTYSLAGIVTGQFKSAFKEKPKDSLYTKKHIKESKKDNSVFIMGDIDFLNNLYAIRVFDFLGNRIVRQVNQNITFLINCLKFLDGDTDLIKIRMRGKYLRPFDKVVELEKKAQEKWLVLDRELTTKISRLNEELNKLEATRKEKDGKKTILSPEQEKKILEFKEKEINFKRQRREIRKKLRQDIDLLGKILTIVNITFIPIILFFIGFFIYNKRKQNS